MENRENGIKSWNFEIFKKIALKCCTVSIKNTLALKKKKSLHSDLKML
jgi:hypothetical protein